jgi:enoyl-CoA hydratase/carnithine racemase
MGVNVDVRGAAAVVALNWPEKRNSIGPSEARQIAAALDEAANTATAGVVLTGIGAFCAGGDLPTLVAMCDGADPSDVATMIYDDIHSILRAIEGAPIPIVAAVDGPAIGLGFDLALLCDMCFVGTHGWLQQGWAVPGLIHGTGGNAVLNRLAPGVSWRLIAEQPKLDAAAAANIGIAEAADGAALDAALDRIERLAKMPRTTLEAYTKLERSLRWPSADFLAECATTQAGLLTSDDFIRRARELLSR